MTKILYKNYVSTHFQSLHDNSLKEYDLFDKYYSKNYLPILAMDHNANILDIGCGFGHFLYFLDKNGYSNYTGIDISTEIVDFCKKTKLFNSKNIHQESINDHLKRKGVKYDYIFMNDVIEHLDKNEIVPTLKKLKKRLNTKGKLVIKVVNASNPITGSASRYNDFTHTIGFTQESLTQVLRMAGYKSVQIKPQDIWVFNPLINIIGFSIQAIFNSLFRFLNLVYGRKSATIFTKDIIAVAE